MNLYLYPELILHSLAAFSAAFCFIGAYNIDSLQSVNSISKLISLLLPQYQDLLASVHVIGLQINSAIHGSKELRELRL